MNNDVNSPRRIQPVKPLHSLHNIDSLMARLDQARPIYDKIVAHKQAFSTQAGENTVTRTGGCKTANPLDEWTDVTDEPIHVLALLEKQGLIATIKVGSHYYSRPAE
jgi:hypothetical protein